MPEGRAWVLDRKITDDLVGAGHHPRGPGLAGRAAGRPAGRVPHRRGHLAATCPTTSAGGFLTAFREPRPARASCMPPLPNTQFARDNTSWIFHGVTLNPMFWPARRQETLLTTGDLPVPPGLRRRGVRRVAGRPRRPTRSDHGFATLEGGDVMPVGKGVVVIGMGERTSHQAITQVARQPVRGRGGRAGHRRGLPRTRAAMHLDTVFTFCRPRPGDGVSRPSSTASCRSACGPTTARRRDWTSGASRSGLVDDHRRGRRASTFRVVNTARRPLGVAARAVGRRQQRRRPRARRRRRLRPQHLHQHRAAQGGRRGHHHHRQRARPRPRRRPLHDLPDPARPALHLTTSSTRTRTAMAFNNRNRSLLSLVHHTERDLHYLLDLSRDLKRAKYAGIEQHQPARQEHRADLREDLHPHPLRVRGGGLRPGRARHLHRPDVLPDRAQGVDEGHRAGAGPDVRRHRVPRLRRRSIVEELAEYAGVPVFNGLTDEFHPTQMLADVLTMTEHCAKPLHEIAYAFVGDGRNNVAQLAAAGRRQARHGRADRRAAGAVAGRRARGAVPRASPPSPAPGSRHRRPGRGRRAASTSSTPTSGCRWASRSRRGASGSTCCCPSRSTPS